MNAGRLSHLTATRQRLRRLLIRIAGIGGADLVSQGVRILIVAWPLDPQTAGLLIVEIASNSIRLAVGLGIALDLFESHFGHWSTPSRWLALSIAVLAVIAAVSAFVSGDVALGLGLTESGQSLALHTLWNNLVVAMLAGAYLTRRRESTEADQRRQAQASRLEHARRRLAGVSAQAAQSRLDPQMLFDCLSRARCVYPGDLDRGDALLTRLTTYLRLTLSIGSGEASTLGREAALASARFDVERRDGDVPFAVDIDPALESRPFPPDLLTGLTVRWMAGAPEDQPRTLRIAAVEDEGSLHLRLRGSCRPPREAIAQCGHEIAKVSGGSVRCVDDDPMQLELEIPNAH